MFVADLSHEWYPILNIYLTASLGSYHLFLKFNFTKSCSELDFKLARFLIENWKLEIIRKNRHLLSS